MRRFAPVLSLLALSLAVLFDYLKTDVHSSTFRGAKCGWSKNDIPLKFK